MSDSRDRLISNFTNKAARDIRSNPSYKTDVLIEGVPKNVIIIGTKYPNEKDIHNLDEEKCFNLGELVYYKNRHWLVVEEDPDDDVFLSGRMKECNYLLRWQNPTTYEIIERWSVVESPYTSGLDEGKLITLGGNQYRIKMQYDDETKLLHLDKRFLIGLSNNKPIAYKTVRFDDITNTIEDNSKGFLTIVVEQDVLQGDDNGELLIANYVLPSDTPPTPSIGLCEITGVPTIKVGGSAKRFTAILKDSEGNIIEPTEPIWSIEPEEISHKITILSQVGNEIRLSASDHSLIGMSFNLKVAGENDVLGYFEKEIPVSIESLW